MELKNLFHVFREKKHNKKGKTGFGGMTKLEKKQLLSNDFIDRMIRVEQRVSSSFGEYVSYNKTRYYQSLTEHEKKNFDKYQKNKKNLWRVAIVMVFISLIGIAIFKINFTGNVVNETLGAGTSSWISNFIIIAMLIGLFLVGITLVLRRKKEKEFHKKFEILDKIVSSRRYIRK